MVVDVKFVKIGNSLSIRIPKIATEHLHIYDGSIGELEIEENELILRPKRHKYSLKQLLSGITKRNLHSEMISGEIGAEAIEE